MCDLFKGPDQGDKGASSQGRARDTSILDTKYSMFVSDEFGAKRQGVGLRSRGDITGGALCQAGSYAGY